MEPVIELIRLEENHEYGTFGVLRINKKVFCVTLEPADLENHRNHSSIPAQQYQLERVFSEQFGETFGVSDVPGRDRVRIHPGNSVSETRGCILVAQHYGKLYGRRAVLNSGQTFSAFMSLMARHDTAHLTIYEFL